VFLTVVNLPLFIFQHNRMHKVKTQKVLQMLRYKFSLLFILKYLYIFRAKVLFRYECRSFWVWLKEQIMCWMQSQHRDGDEIISARSAIKCIHTSLSAVKISATCQLTHNSNLQHYWLHHQYHVYSNCKETAKKKKGGHSFSLLLSSV
jgi:hypothetical protein